MLMNSFCILYAFFNSSFNVRSFQSSSNIDLKESTEVFLLEYTIKPTDSENFSALGFLSSALMNFSPSPIYMPYGELFPFRTCISGALSDVLLTISALTSDNGQIILQRWREIFVVNYIFNITSPFAI